MYYQSTSSGSSQKTKLAWRLGVDGAIIVSLLAVIAYYGFFGNAFKRGFFCNDSDLSHPYRDSSISAAVLYTSSVLVPMVVVCLAEYVRMRRFRSGWKTCLSDAYIHFVIWYGFGAVATQAITYVIKFYASRLRPHFFAICQPDFSALQPLCSAGQYITDYNCTNTEVTPKRIREAFISFPSGHASFGFHAAMFLVLYLRQRWDKNFGGVVVRPFVQLAFLVAAFIVCISRVNDFKHFPTDVFAGGLLGISVAIFLYNCLDFADLRATYFLGEDEVAVQGRGVSCERGSSMTERRPGDKSRRRRGEKPLKAAGGGGNVGENKSYKTFDECHDSLVGVEYE